MNCRDLNRYLRDEMSPDERIEMLDHIDTCLACRTKRVEASQEAFGFSELQEEIRQDLRERCREARKERGRPMRDCQYCGKSFPLVGNRYTEFCSDRCYRYGAAKGRFTA